MPDFIITDNKSGKKYKVSGPTKEGALEAFKTKMGGGDIAPPPKDTSFSSALTISALLSTLSTNSTSIFFGLPIISSHVFYINSFHLPSHTHTRTHPSSLPSSHLSFSALLQPSYLYLYK